MLGICRAATVPINQDFPAIIDGRSDLAGYPGNQLFILTKKDFLQLKAFSHKGSDGCNHGLQDPSAPNLCQAQMRERIKGGEGEIKLVFRALRLIPLSLYPSIPFGRID
jgi:hypothetical protein